MRDDLEAELSDWGRSETPQADGAFANRLETSLRRDMLNGYGFGPLYRFARKGGQTTATRLFSSTTPSIPRTSVCTICFK